MVDFQTFHLEKLQSEWEQEVAYNLAESGVHPLSLAELLAGTDDLEGLLATRLHYPQVNGILPLREHIAALYPGAGPDNVLVTVGCAEANFIATQTVCAPGQEMVVMLPNYLQVWGLGHNYGLKVKTFYLREEGDRWTPDLDELEAVVSGETRLIAVCNPNNPTGSILTGAEMDRLVAIAGRVGAWLLADEVYSGVEQFTDSQTPSFWGRYDRVLATNSLSKAYGLPGLRTGWVVAPAGMVADIWRRHEYTTITTTTLANRLAALALSPEVRPRLLKRAREHARRGLAILNEWLGQYPAVFSLAPPQAAAIAFVRYHLDIGSTELVNRLIREKSVLIGPGEHFGLDFHLRVGLGSPPDYLRAGLGRIRELVEEIGSTPPGGAGRPAFYAE